MTLKDEIDDAFRVTHADDGEDHVTVRLHPGGWVMAAVALLMGVALGGSALGALVFAVAFAVGYASGRIGGGTR